MTSGVARQVNRGMPAHSPPRALLYSLGLLLLHAGAVQGQGLIPLPFLDLEPGDSLPVLVGGPTPILEHDLYSVSGVAILDGRVELDLINGYEPLPGDEITFLEADSVSQQFRSHYFPEPLPADVAVEFFQTETTFGARFDTPILGNGLAPGAATSPWFNEASWVQGAVPASRDILVLSNEGVPQLVQVVGDPSGGPLPAAVHQITVQGNGAPMALQISQGVQFSASLRVDVAAQGLIELDGGSLVSNKIHIASGGLLLMDAGSIVTGMATMEVAGHFAGTGDISGAVSVLDAGDFEVGLPSSTTADAVSINGNYAQASQGRLSMDVPSELSGSFDTLQVSGDAALSGFLEVDMTGFTSLTIGESIEILTAGNLPSDSRFSMLEPIGLTPNGVYPGLEYSSTSASLVGYSVGDMDRDTDLDTDDVDLFVLALIDRQAYELTELTNGSKIGISADITGDIDFDGDMDFDDIDDLITLLPAPVATYAREVLLGMQVPEPGSSAVLLMLGAALCPRRTRR